MQVFESFSEITFPLRFVIIKATRIFLFLKDSDLGNTAPLPRRSLLWQCGILLRVKDAKLHWEEILCGSLWLYSASLVHTGIQ